MIPSAVDLRLLMEGEEVREGAGASATALGAVAAPAAPAAAFFAPPAEVAAAVAVVTAAFEEEPASPSEPATV